MRVKLLRQHMIDDALREPNEILEVSVVTPYMEGLDPEARKAIYDEKVRVFGRWVYDEHNVQYLLDDPPIERPIEENQPVRRIPGVGPR
jgi:hypothetical protein